MNLISCYGSLAMETHERQREVSLNVFQGKISEKLFYKIYEKFGVSIVTFTNPQIDFTNRLNYKITNIPNDSLVEFNLLMDSVMENYQYWFEVGMDLCKSTIRITCKVLKNGLPLKSHNPGIIQLLIEYAMRFLYFDQKDHSLRVNPIDGTIKYSSVNFFTRKDFLEKLSYPSYLCDELKEKISHMQDIMNRNILGRILEVYNQIPFCHIVPKDKEKSKSLNPLFQSVDMKRLRRLEKQCRKISQYTKVSQYNIKQMCINNLKDDKSVQWSSKQIEQDFNIRFSAQRNLENYKRDERLIQRIMRDYRKFNLNIIQIFKLFSNRVRQNSIHKVKTFFQKVQQKGSNLPQKNARKNEKKEENAMMNQINPEKEIQTDPDYLIKKQQIKNIRKCLKIDDCICHEPNLVHIYIWKILDQAIIRKGFGGQIYIVKCELSPIEDVINYNQQMEKYQNGQIVVAPPPVERKTILIARKYENPQSKNRRLFREKTVINSFENSSCIFIQKYFRCTFSPESGVDESFEQDNIFMEYRYDRTLSVYHQYYSSFMSLKTKLVFIYQILTGLRFLRDKGTYHLDLKPENILVRITSAMKDPERYFYFLKLLDFGESYTKSAIGSNSAPRGLTIPYASPEQQNASTDYHSSVKNQEFYFEKSDIFSLGVMILILFFDFGTSDLKFLKKADWQKQSWNQFYSICVQKSRYYGPQIHMLTLLEMTFLCLSHETTKRPSLDWMTVIIKSLYYSLERYHYYNDLEQL